MKILIANHRYFVSSGPERYMFNVMKRLQEAGHGIIPFSVRYTQNEPSPYSKYFVPSLGKADQVYFDQHRSSARALPRTFGRLFYSMEVERAVERLAAETKPDIAYILHYLRKLSPSLLVALKKKKIPIVVRLSDYGMFCAEHHCLRNNQPCSLCLDGSLIHSVRHKCVKGSRTLSAIDAAASAFHRWRRYFDLVDIYVTTNPFMQDMMVKAGYPSQRLQCIPTFTDVEMFSPPSIPPTESYIISMCRLDPPKGLHVLIDALALLYARSRNVPVTKIIGTGHNGAYVASLKDKVRTAGLDEKIIFAGHLKPGELPAVLRGAICSVVPALWFENLPNTLIESLSCGVPVIASDIGSLSTAITDGVDGLLHRPGDAEDLAEKIECITSNAVLRNTLSTNGRKTALTKYSPQSHMARLVSLFRSLIPAQDSAADFARQFEHAAIPS